MRIHLHPDATQANAAAADCLSAWLESPGARALMVAAGNTPLNLYNHIGQRNLMLDHLNVFILDEYVGVPSDEPRNCSNLLKHSVAHSWRIPPPHFFTINSEEPLALASVRAHEQRIEAGGGLDAIVLGLGQNGHLGFNEPGSPENSAARIVDLEQISIDANRAWFAGRYAPRQGATIGLKTILAARKVLIMAFGPHKAQAVQAMVHGPRSTTCPASFLQGHPSVDLFIDSAAGSLLNSNSIPQTP